MFSVRAVVLLSIGVAVHSQARADDLMSLRSGVESKARDDVSPATASQLVNGIFVSSPCGFTKKVKEKIQKTEPGGEAWVPEAAQRLVKDLDKVKLRPYESDGLRAVLHIARVDGQELSLDMVPTYTSLDVQQFMDTQKDNYVLLLDCSAMASMMADSSLGLSKNEIKASAQGAASKEVSKMALRAFVWSPLNSALDPALAAQHVSHPDRVAILFALMAATAKHGPEAKVTYVRKVEALATSEATNSAFNGAAKVDATGTGAAGLVSLKGEVSSGLSVTRTVQYSDFATYLNTDGIKEAEITVGEVRDRLDEALVAVGSSADVKQAQTYAEVKVSLPANMCQLPWKLTAFREPEGGWDVVPDLGSVGKGIYDSAAQTCTFDVKLSQAGKTFITPTPASTDQDQEGKVILEYSVAEGLGAWIPVRLVE